LPRFLSRPCLRRSRRPVAVTRRAVALLLDAVIGALEAEAAEEDTAKRVLILQTTRTILDAWRDERVTTEEAVRALLALRPSDL